MTRGLQADESSLARRPEEVQLHEDMPQLRALTKIPITSQIIRISLCLAIHGCISVRVICPSIWAKMCPSCRLHHAQTHIDRTSRCSWASHCASKRLTYSTGGFTAFPSADVFIVEPAFASKRPWHVNQSQNAWTPSLHWVMFSVVPEAEQACWSVSGCKSRYCAELVILMCCLESALLQVSQLAKQATVPRRLCRSLHELVSCWAASGISVSQAALMSCSCTGLAEEGAGLMISWISVHAHRS